jgi:acetyl-CoA carboxylase, biotin carboxyl carrier protein
MGENTAMAKAQDKDPGGTRKKSSGISAKSAGTSNPSFNMDELRELASLVDEHGFTDFEFENANIRVRLSKMTPAPVLQAYAPAPTATSAPATATPAKTESESPAAQAESDADLFKITSPIVGTFYSSPGPDKEAYVKEGSMVSDDTVICIVEAMKLMNEIQAEVTGEVVRIYVENGQPVEYGQPLFGIKK